MKKGFLDFIVLSVLCICLYFVLTFIFERWGINASPVNAGLLLTLFCLSFSYNRLWSRNSIKSKRGILALTFSGTLLFFTFTVISFIYHDSSKLYSCLVSDHKRGWKGKVHKVDDILGFVPVPNARGYLTFPFAPDIPLAYDADGFRVALKDTMSSNDGNRTDLLFLGCSFTYGDACYAEETFPYLVAEENSLTYKNAGGCSYGLSQMLILAEKLIPKYHPKYVIVQHSPWLIQRAVNPFAPVYYGSLPCPYFIDSAIGFGIHPPLYRSQIFDLDAESTKKESRFSFLIKTGFKFYLKDYYLKLKSKINIFFNKNLRPAADAAKAEEYAYQKIIQTAKKYKSKVIVLSLCSNDDSTNFKKQISQDDVYFANADSVLNSNLKTTKTKNLIKEYSNWRNVDPHPNPVAHQLIAKSILQVINEK